MKVNKNLPITCNKTVSFTPKRKERKVSDYNAYLEQFDLVATYNGWSESEKFIVLASNLKVAARQAKPTGLAKEPLTYEQLCERLRESFIQCASLPTT